MSNYIVTDSELTSVANAIRTKGGTNGSLIFPGGFTSAINAISGGGSSDFSTAEVTVINNGEHIARFVSPVILSNDTISPDAPLRRSNVNTFKVVLYKDACYNEIVITDPTTVENLAPSSMSGGVSYDEEEMIYTITGDCTITIS